jgi:hypothetical protein
VYVLNVIIKATIPGWPDYMITSTATVLSYKGKDRAERTLKAHDGRVWLRRNGQTYSCNVDWLMELAYWTPAPKPRKARCAAGHLYAENTMAPLASRPNARRCRKCHAIWMARWRRKRATATETG